MRKKPIEQIRNAPASSVIALLREHEKAGTWAKKDRLYWFSRLAEEVGELSQAINERNDEGPTILELAQIASIALNWLRRETGNDHPLSLIEWIPVEEWNAKDGQRVLVQTGATGMVTEGWFEEMDRGWCVRGGGGSVMRVTISRVAEIPEVRDG